MPQILHFCTKFFYENFLIKRMMSLLVTSVKEVGSVIALVHFFIEGNSKAVSYC